MPIFTRGRWPDSYSPWLWGNLPLASPCFTIQTISHQFTVDGLSRGPESPVSRCFSLSFLFFIPFCFSDRRRLFARSFICDSACPFFVKSSTLSGWLFRACPRPGLVEARRYRPLLLFFRFSPHSLWERLNFFQVAFGSIPRQTRSLSLSVLVHHTRLNSFPSRSVAGLSGAYTPALSHPTVGSRDQVNTSICRTNRSVVALITIVIPGNSALYLSFSRYMSQTRPSLAYNRIL